MSSRSTIPENIIYVEPNDAKFEYEDLSIFLKLNVYVPSRNYLKSRGGGKDYTVVWDGKGVMQTLGEASEKTGYLSTYYTDLSWKEKINGGVEEAFGIESVEISYRTWFYPEVTIKFVDIRASALFKTAEGHVDDENVTNIILQSFFSFPYPNFEMTVKGFFGKAVTYHLIAQTFKASFSSTSGNFEAIGTFIGEVYGSLADIPMKFLFVSPFLENAKLGTFPGTTTEIPTFPGLVKIMNDSLIAAAEYARTERERSADLTSEVLKLSQKIKVMEFFQNWLGHHDVNSPGAGYMGNNYSIVIVRVNDQSWSEFSSQIETDGTSVSDGWTAYYNAITTIGTTIRGAGLESMLVDIITNSGGIRYTPGVTFGSTTIEDVISALRELLDGTTYGDYLYVSGVAHDGLNHTDAAMKRWGFLHTWHDSDDDIDNYFPAEMHAEIRDCVTHGISAASPLKVFYSVLKFGKETITQLKNEYTQKSTELESRSRDITEGAEREFNKKVGFKPTIRNMFYIVFAHLSLFVKQYGNVIDTIMDSTDRTFEEDLVRDTDFIPDSDRRLGPYPMVYSSQEPKDIIYPGYRLEFENLYELDYVQAIFDAVKKEYSEYLKEFARGTGLSGATGIGNLAFLPTLSSDLLHLSVNPYRDVFTKKPEAKLNAINTVFAMREATYLVAGDQYFIGWREDMEGSSTNYHEIKLWCEIEAYNAYLAIRSLGDDIFNETIGGIEDFEEFWKNDVTGSDASAPRVTNEKIFVEDSDGTFNINAKKIIFNYTEDLLTALVEDGSSDSTIKGAYTKVYAPTGDEKSSYKLYSPTEVATMFDQISAFASAESSKLAGTYEEYMACVKNFFFNSDAVAGGGENGIELDSASKSIFATVAEDVKIGMSAIVARTWVPGTEDEYNFQRCKAMCSQQRKYDTIHQISVEGLRLIGMAVNDSSRLGPAAESTESYLTMADFHFLKNDWICDVFLTYYLIEIKNLSEEAFLRIDGFGDYASATGGYGGFKAYINDIFETHYPTPSELAGYNDHRWFYFCMFMTEIDIEYKDQNDSVLNSILYRELSLPNYANCTMCRVKYIELMCWFWRKVLPLAFFYGGSYTPGADYKRLYMDWSADASGVTHDLFFEYVNTWWETFKKFCHDHGGNFLRSKIKHPYTTTMRGGNPYTRWSISSDLQKTFFEMPELKLSKDNDVFVCSSFFRNMPIDFFAGSFKKNLSTYIERSYISSWLNETDVQYINGTLTFYNLKDNDIAPVTTTMAKVFYESLKEYFTGATDTASAAGMLTIDPTEVIATKAQKLSIYLTLKNLYDRWQLNNETLKDFAGDNEDFSNFRFYDAFRRDIGDKIIVGIPNFFNLCSMVNDANGEESEGMSVYAFLSEMCKQNDCIFVSLPIDVYGGINSAQDYLKLFEPIPYANIAANTSKCPSFLCIYPGKPSEHVDLNGYSDGYDDDGADFLRPDGVERADDDTDDTNEKLPLFGITYGYQKQHLFKKVDISMENPKNTEYSLKSTLFISQQGAERTVTTAGFVGNDVYNAYANSMYTCNVEMMGDMCIMPTMYFQLNNVPLFRGTYMITNVKHVVRGGNINTSFTGVRLNRYCFEPLKETVDLTEIMDTDKVYAFNGNAGDVERGISAKYDKEHTFTEVYATIGASISSTPSSVPTGDGESCGGSWPELWRATIGPLSGCCTLEEKLTRLGVPALAASIDSSMSSFRWTNTSYRGQEFIWNHMEQMCDDVSNLLWGGNPVSASGDKHMIHGLGTVLQQVFDAIYAVFPEYEMRISSYIRRRGGGSMHDIGCALDINGYNSGGADSTDIKGNPWLGGGSREYAAASSAHDAPANGNGAHFYNNVAKTQAWDSFAEGSFAGGSARAYHLRGFGNCVFGKNVSIWAVDHPIVKIFRQYGFGWGGCFGDTMHFSLTGH